MTLKLPFLTMDGFIVLTQGHGVAESFVAGMTGVRPLISGVGPV